MWTQCLRLEEVWHMSRQNLSYGSTHQSHQRSIYCMRRLKNSIITVNNGDNTGWPKKTLCREKKVGFSTNIQHNQFKCTHQSRARVFLTTGENFMHKCCKTWEIWMVVRSLCFSKRTMKKLPLALTKVRFNTHQSNNAYYTDDCW